MITANKQVIQPVSCVLTVRACEAGCDEFVVCRVASNAQKYTVQVNLGSFDICVYVLMV